MSAWFMFAFVSTVWTADAVSEARFAEGRSAYAANDFDRAGAMFRELLDKSPPVSTPARYALANSLVQRAKHADAAGPMTNAWLREAIDHYRQLLDAGVVAPLSADDIRCNLAIAKRSLHWSKSTAESNDADDNRESPSGNEKNGSAPASAPSRKSSPLADPSRPAEDKGDVLSPSVGIPFVDPGPIPRAAAEQQIAERVRRLEQDAKEKPPIPPRFRPSTKDDY